MKKLCTFLLILMALVGCKVTTPQTYTITFDTIDGTSIPSVDISKGMIMMIPDDPEREGYTFDWWYLDTEYTTPLDLSYTPTSSITIYAKWIPNQYQIAFVINGGVAISPMSALHGEPITLPTPTRQYYTFAGWYRDIELENAFLSTELITGAITLYAKWEEIIHPLLELEEYIVTYVVTNMGEDTTRMNINYQAKNILTYLEYDTDVNFSLPTRVDPTMTYFESLSDEMEKVFTGRNICRVELMNLTPATTYYYRINQGNGTYTEVFSFRTEGENDTTDFIFMTDIHYYDGYDGAEVSEDVILQAQAYNPNIDFVLNTGDIIDTGGNADDWDKYFTHANHFKTLPVAGITGNHEHYFVGSMKNRIYSSYFNYPDNGIESFRGTSYYFIHNDTLFIQVDTDSPYDQGKQLEWIASTIEAHPTKFIIVGTHAPVNYVGSNDYNRAFMAVMEKYAVDLVLAGHSHSQDYNRTYLDEAPINSQIGVAYFMGAGGGIKGIGSGVDPKDFAKGYVISVGDTAITIQVINGNGVLGKQYTIENYKLAPKETTTPEEIMASFNYEENLENETIRFYWSEKAYKNVKSITITQTYREQATFESIVPTPGYTETTFKNHTPSLDHQYVVTVVFMDDTVEIRTFDQNLSGGMGLEVTTTSTTATLTFNAPSEDNLANIKRYEVYNKQGTLLGTFNAKDVSFQAITSILLEGLPPNTEMEIIVHAIGRDGFMYSDSIEFNTKS
ncbi:MAG: InlB B-repeat-containing protein [Bacilli bacterium]|nr:InlB B-repeat-containing protein [Bacilli bacterium]